VSSGVIGQGGPLTLSNSGTIIATTTTTISTGVNLWVGGSLTNNAGGSISGSTYGVYMKCAVGTLTNYGSISGSRALDIRAGGHVINAASGSISGSIQGVLFTSVAGTLTNSGRVTATATDGAGIYLASGGTITNNAGALISGGGGGVLIAGGSGTLITAGTISGTAYAVHFANNAANLLVVEPGVAFVGAIAGGSGNDTLELDGSAGNPLTVNYNGVGLSNFEDVLFGPGGYATLAVTNTSGTPGIVFSGFTATSDTIDLTAIGTDGTITNNDTVAHRVTVTGSLGSVTLQFDASVPLATASDGASGTDLFVACFCRGTRLLTDQDEVPVEDLKIGDKVVTVSGALAPIKWIGQRTYDPRFISGNRNVLPICVTAGSLGDGLPTRDLSVSPEHALYIDGLLVPARLLVNGTTIVQAARVETLGYFHIELDAHEIIFAEGATAESFVDFGGRGMFQNSEEFAALYPDAAPADWQAYGALLDQGRAGLPAIRARLLGRAEILGRVSRDPDLHLIVDGRVVRAQSIEGLIHCFSVPAGARGVNDRLAQRGAERDGSGFP
jgi:Hint domain-containing protein